MNSASQLSNRASEIVDAARRFEAAAGAPGSYPGVPDSLAALETGFQLLSAAWYRLAADASPDLADRRRATSAYGAGPRADGLSREQAVRVLATLHEVAAAFARAARTCRSAHSRVAPIIELRLAAARANGQKSEPERRVA